MQRELTTYDDIPKLRADAEARKEEAQRAGSEAKAAIGSLKANAAEAKTRYEEMKNKLARDDVSKGLEDLEAKMKVHEQTVYVLTEYIETKGAESLFEPIAEDCLNIIQSVNAETIKVLAERPVFNGFAAY